MLTHPDKAGDNKYAAGAFRLINEAYETLKDPAKRAAYDVNKSDQPTVDGELYWRGVAYMLMHEIHELALLQERYENLRNSRT